MQNETTYNQNMPSEYCNFVSAAEYLEKAEKRSPRTEYVCL